MILLDTDILTLLFFANPRVLQRWEAAPELPAVSIVTRIEVLRGRFESLLKAADSAQVLVAQARLADAEKDLAKYQIVTFDDSAAKTFDRFRQDKKLNKIERNDMLTACIALANRATLVTRNLRHFRLVPGLKLENWAD